MRDIQLIGVPGIPLIQSGDDVLDIVLVAIDEAGLTLQAHDMLVITSKIVSKAEGRWVDLMTVTPDEEAHRVAEVTGKDPREVALILSEANRISRMRQGVLIVEHTSGVICANAGIDHSNTRADGEWRLLLPTDSDSTARRFRETIHDKVGVDVGVILSDSQGRPFRMGTVGIAIGSAGLPALWDLRGRQDLFGKTLVATEVALADEIAAAAGLVMGQTSENAPVVIVRGVHYPADAESQAKHLIRPKHLDLYG